MQKTIYHRFLKDIPLPDYLWAFEPERNIPQMVQMHCNKQWVVSFDLSNFFRSITNRHILAVLEQLRITDEAASTLTELLTYKFFLPQGAVTSPKVSNMVAWNTFAEGLFEIFSNAHIAMSIYADDVTLSFNMDDPVTLGFLRSLRPQDTDMSEDNPTWFIEHLNAFMVRQIEAEGFRLNRAKTKFMSKTCRQTVCGVVTNVKANLPRRDRLWLRAVVHNIVTNGVEAEAAKNDINPDTFLLKIRGKIQWFTQLNPEAGTQLLTKLDTYVAGTPYGSPSPVVPTAQQA